MDSLVRKRSIVLRGVRTSISLEGEFWFALKEISEQKSLRVRELIEQINNDHKRDNLSSTLRLYVLSYYKNRCGEE